MNTNWEENVRRMENFKTYSCPVEYESRIRRIFRIRFSDTPRHHQSETISDMEKPIEHGANVRRCGLVPKSEQQNSSFIQRRATGTTVNNSKHTRMSASHSITVESLAHEHNQISLVFLQCIGRHKAQDFHPLERV